MTLCWKCHEPTAGPVCVGCGAIQPPQPEPDLFALLGLPRQYRLDLPEIESKYRDLSRLVHPDRFAGRSAVERRMSLQWTASANAARRVLKDPIARARYLATGKAEVDEKGTPVAPEFLEEMFELRERATDEPDAIAAIAQQRIDALMAELDTLFQAGTIDQVPERLARIAYLDGILHEH